MKLRLDEIIELYYELNGRSIQSENDVKVISKGLLAQKLNLKTKLYLQRLNKVVLEEVKMYEELEKELVKKYDNIQENIESYLKDKREILSAEKDIDVSNLWSSDLKIEDINLETEEFYPVFLKLLDHE